MEILPPSIFYLRFQAGTPAIVSAAGLVLSAFLLLGASLYAWRKVAVERARADERMTRDDAHRRFVRRLNHELKNPLTAVRAGLANVAQPCGAEADRAASLANVRGQVERLGRLVDDLRKLVDLETSRPEMEAVDLASVVDEAVELARGVPGRESREIAVLVQKVPWSLDPVYGDRDLLLLAIYNLLDNAIKFSGPAALVEVRALEDGTQARIEVADTGPGIETEEMPHLAEELFRGRNAQGIEGSGLGLSLVQHIAALHGGQLTFQSRKGEGTVATLRVPLNIG